LGGGGGKKLKKKTISPKRKHCSLGANTSERKEAELRSGKKRRKKKKKKRGFTSVILAPRRKRKKWTGQKEREGRRPHLHSGPGSVKKLRLERRRGEKKRNPDNLSFIKGKVANVAAYRKKGREASVPGFAFVSWGRGKGK